MKILVFDTETTGLINKKEKDLDKQPHLIQFAGIVGEIRDGEYIEIERINQLIKPPIPIPIEASQVHHLYEIDVKNSPRIEEKLHYFCELINDVDIVVGHNISFDIGVLQVEINRLKSKGINIDFQPKKTFCTMEESINYCRLPKKSGKGFKRPKLQELVKKSLGVYFNGAHDALIDTEWTTKAFVKLWNEGIFKLKEREQIGLFN